MFKRFDDQLNITVQRNIFPIVTLFFITKGSIHKTEFQVIKD